MQVSSAGADGPPSWLSSLSQCCAPLASCFGWKSRRNHVKVPQAVVREQPAYPSSRTAPPEEADSGSSEKTLDKSQASSRRNKNKSMLKKRIRTRSDASSRRPRISEPSNFCHLESGSFLFDPEAPQPHLRPDPPNRGSSFRRLELSIYRPSNRMSPILPHFEFPSLDTTPSAAELQERLDDDRQVVRLRSNSTPFHLPRKPLPDVPVPAFRSVAGPEIPAKSEAREAARARAYTSPDLEVRKARIADAMNEVEKLQQQIDDVVERQSLYTASRPSTAHSMARTMPELEPMPSIPALPPTAAPSFAERLNLDLDRPQTAPLRTEFEISNRSQEFGESMSALSTPTHRVDDRLPPPPLPLVLRPPLRKKKSFSRVSTWLFPQTSHEREVSLDSLTNLPRPVKDTDGFYQCVDPEGTDRRSFETTGTTSPWDSEEEQPTLPTSSWSPGSTAVARQGETAGLERTTTFGKSSSPAVRSEISGLGARRYPRAQGPMGSSGITLA